MSYKKTISKTVDTYSQHGIALFRIAIGILFATHGVATLFGVLGGAKDNPGHAAEFGSWPSWWAGLIQLVAGLAIALGIGTRTAAFIGSGSMAYAYFVVHQPKGLLPIENGGVPAALYAWALFVLIFIGPGTWALQSVVSAKRSTAEPTGDKVPEPASS